MKRVLTYFLLAGFAIAIPVLAAPAFVGPPASPPAGNVEGVIWNIPSGGLPQSANINITGNAAMNTVNTASGVTNQLYGENDLEDGKRFRIQKNGSANYDMGNWGGIGGVKKPLTFTINGGLTIQPIPPGTTSLGIDGRIQAERFCFNGGDCIDGPTWPSGGGSGGTPAPGGDFVFRGGDSMTGTLTVSTSTFGIKGLDIDTPGGSRIGNGSRYLKIGETLSTLEVENDQNASAIKVLPGNFGSNAYGIEVIPPAGATAAGIRIGSPTGSNQKALEAYSDQRAILGNSISAMGGEFVGATYGVDARTRTAAVGTAVRGTNGAAGGDFTGTVTGIVANGGSSGSYFTNGTGQYTYLAYPGFGIFSDVGGASNYGMYTNGQIVTTANMSAADITATGDLDATPSGSTGNQWGGASSPAFDTKYGGAWPNLGGTITWSTRGNRCGKYSGVVGPGAWFVCPDGTYMSGYHTDGTGKIDNAVCCEL